MEFHTVTIVRSAWALAKSDAERAEIVRVVNELAGAAPTRPELCFDDERRIVSWNGGQVKFRSNGVRRYLLVKELYFSDEGCLSAAEIGELLDDDDLKSWESIRKLGERTNDENLSPNQCPFEITIDRKNQSLGLFPRKINLGQFGTV